VPSSLSQLQDALSGRYSVLEELGQGGMATVYLAEDVKHDRKVALKVLKPELAAVLGGDRFVVEIKTTAALQHPHILPLFDSGEAGGFLYYVMPFIDGETLRSKLSRETQLGVAESLRIAGAIADALDYAHRQGVVHRDIKPENILLHEGRPVVADFGIALAVSAAAGGRMTETGLSLGTPHYMSPEQATAEKEITGRSDIYSLASVLYEMLTGNPPHTGSSAQQIIMKIITESAQPVTALRKSVPTHVAAAVAQALEKLPADRFESAKAFAEALGDPKFTLATHAAKVTPESERATRRRQVSTMAPWVALVIVTGLLASTPFRGKEGSPPPVTRFRIVHDSAGGIIDQSGSPIAFSPDGSRIVYTGQRASGAIALFSRMLDSHEPVEIPGTVEAFAPFISPDGEHVAFAQEGKLRRVPFSGGTAATIVDAAPNSAAWAADGTIYYTGGRGLSRVSAAGEHNELFVPLDTTRFQAMRWPDPTPDGRSILVTVVKGSAPHLAVVTLPEGKVEELGLPGMYPRYVNDDRLVFLQTDGTLAAIGFNSRKRRLVGAPVPIVSDVRYGPAFPGKLGVSRTGSVAYMQGTAARREIVMVDSAGGATVVKAPSLFYQVPRFSPDGSRLSVVVTDYAARAKSDLWTLDLRTANLTRVTFDSINGAGTWAGDGRRIIYFNGSTFFRIPVDGSGAADSLFTRSEGILQELEVSRDGTFMVWQERGDATGRDLMIASVDTPRVIRPLVRTRFEELHPALSPDGRWLAYASNETGSFEIFIRRVEQGSGRWRVSTAGGHSPRWGSGAQLFFRHGDTLQVVDIDLRQEPAFSAPRMALEGRYNLSWSVGYDVAPDGRRFVFTRSQGAGEVTPMFVILNWFAHHPLGKGRTR
jgi:eukaryotic-like serine/threonine-protein kinase